ncbi:transglycosylase SLT domain-containing protein [Limnohabitans sp.]|uniref:transglycosylase SLT domain-containing protein n=1 Tax=Limnohabitans sp. TaxID=1907725 RepID=UPI00286ECD6A|nr:transglycosylase SLT domain-containing protein [Limnohabitans sp.]
MRFLLAVLSISLSLSLVLLTGCASLPEQGNVGLSPVAKGNFKRDNVAKLELSNDLWERIRKGYQMPDLESDLVNDRTQWYANKPDYIQRMSERSSKYLFHIVEELETRKMPTELALLPFIESAFNPQAVSSARASGMWQFMPATGKSFDLKQNVFRDDRRDVQASTRAALDYLERLHKMFGDWHLALAAYNWGEGNVGKAIARNKRAGLPTTYADLNMPMETRMYVPKLQAMKNLVGNPPAYNLVLPSIPNHPYFQSVPLPRDMDVSVAAKLADIPLEDFKALNPSAHRPVLLAAGSPNILLPWDNAEVFQRNYEASSIARMATWTAWIAPTTMKVADAAKKVNMTETDFRAINNIPPRMLIKAGSALMVPRSVSMLGDVTAQVADNGKLDLSPEAVAKRKDSGKGEKHANGTKLASAKDIKGAGAKQVAEKKGKGDAKIAKK